MTGNDNWARRAQCSNGGKKGERSQTHWRLCAQTVGCSTPEPLGFAGIPSSVYAPVTCPDGMIPRYLRVRYTVPNAQVLDHPRMTPKASNPTAAMLRRLVARCPVCDSDLAGHRFAQVASTVASQDNKQRVEELFGHVRRHSWNALSEYKDFRGDQNAALVYVVIGPHKAGVVFLIRDPFELYESQELCVQEQFGAEEAAELAVLAPPEKWQDF